MAKTPGQVARDAFAVATNPGAWLVDTLTDKSGDEAAAVRELARAEAITVLAGAAFAVLALHWLDTRKGRR